MSKIPPGTILGPDSGMYSPLLMCTVLHMEYDFSGKNGNLLFADGECCDMNGAIKFFEAIDKDVRTINTRSRGKNLVSYLHETGEWVAHTFENRDTK